MAKTNISNHILTGKSKNKDCTVLGEFWIDSDGEVFVDPTDPVPGLRAASKLTNIQQLQKKENNKQIIQFATRYSNRRPPA